MPQCEPIVGFRVQNTGEARSSVPRRLCHSYVACSKSYYVTDIICVLTVFNCGYCVQCGCGEFLLCEFNESAT